MFVLVLADSNKDGTRHQQGKGENVYFSRHRYQKDLRHTGRDMVMVNTYSTVDLELGYGRRSTFGSGSDRQRGRSGADGERATGEKMGEYSPARVRRKFWKKSRAERMKTRTTHLSVGAWSASVTRTVEKRYWPSSCSRRPCSISRRAMDSGFSPGCGVTRGPMNSNTPSSCSW